MRGTRIARRLAANMIDAIHLIEMGVAGTWYNQSMPQRGEHISEGEESILGQEFVEGILNQARRNLEKDGSLVPVLFLLFKGGERGILPLALPETTAERQAYFRAIGLAFQSTRKPIAEALMVSETWYVAVDKDKPLSLDVRPSQHPKRREAITVMGRDAERSRYTAVIQLFHRDRHRHPVFEPITEADYNAFVTPGTGPVGLLDDLFPKRSRLLN